MLGKGQRPTDVEQSTDGRERKGAHTGNREKACRVGAGRELGLLAVDTFILQTGQAHLVASAGDGGR